MRAILLAVLLGGLAMTATDAEAQDKKKDFKGLDADAMKAFKDGDYEEAHKIWQYIHNDYPRDAYRNLADNDPKKIAWRFAFYSSIARGGLAKKHILLASDDAVKKASADRVYAEAIEDAREGMTRNSIPKADQDKLIKSATQPLLDILKKKDAPEKK